MEIFINRSIALSKVSRHAWGHAGAIVLSRNEFKRKGRLSAVPFSDRVVVNLGIAPTVDGAIVYNTRNMVRSILTPASLRKTMPSLIPPIAKLGESAWFKGPGYAGKNKTYYHAWGGDGFDEAKWDIQKHIEGTEYRVISVGNRIVQAFIKTPDDSPCGFTWKWVGANGIKNLGIRPLVREAVGLIVDIYGDFSIIGWDIIRDASGQCFIIEGNTSPGVNVHSAKRIVKQIRNDNGND